MQEHESFVRIRPSRDALGRVVIVVAMVSGGALVLARLCRDLARRIAAELGPGQTFSTRPFRPVVLEGLTVQPRAEVSGQAKWITWVVRSTGMHAVGEQRGDNETHTKPGSAIGSTPGHGRIAR